MAAVFNTTTNNTNIISTTYTGGATQVITCMAWVYLPAATPATWRDIVVLDPNIYMQVLNSSTAIDFGTANNDHAGSALNLNTWYHVAQVVVPTSTTSRQIYGYLNGALNVNVTDGDTSVAFTNISVGSSSFSTFTLPLNGYVRDVRVWTTQLSAADIAAEMNSATPISKPALLLWLPLDDGNALDKSGNENIITVGSAVTTTAGPLRPFPKKNVRSF